MRRSAALARWRENGVLAPATGSPMVDYQSRTVEHVGPAIPIDFSQRRYDGAGAPHPKNVVI